MRKPRAKIYQDAAGGWRWRLRAGNNRIIAESGESYVERRKCIEALDLLSRVGDRVKYLEAMADAVDEARA